MSIRSNNRSIPSAPQAPIRRNDEETFNRSATDDPLAGLTVDVEGVDPPSYDRGIGSLSLGDDFDDEAAAVAAATTAKKGNGARKISTGSRFNPPRGSGGGQGSLSGSLNGPYGGDDSDDATLAAETKLKSLLKDGLMELLGVTRDSRGRPKKQREDSSDEEDDDYTPAKTVLGNGLILKKGAPRSVDEIVKTKVQLSRFKRGEEGSTTADKLRTRWCVSLKGTFKSPDWASLTAVDSAGDVAEGVIETKNVVREFAEWCEKADVSSIFKILKGLDDETMSLSSNPLYLLRMNETTDILTKYQELSVFECRKQQAFVLTHCDPVDVVSSDWALEKLKNSTESSLYQRVKQVHDHLPKEEQGGITFFKLLMDDIDKHTFEGEQALIDWSQKVFDLRNYDGEDVPKATTHYKSVMSILGDKAPTAFVRNYLVGMSKCSTQEFVDVCNVNIAALSTTHYRAYVRSARLTKLQELDDVAGSLLERYLALSQTAGGWKGSLHKSSTFKASLMTAAGSEVANAVEKSDKLSFTEWFDKQICAKKYCGGRHPTNYHNNLEARDRPRQERGRPRQSQDRYGRSNSFSRNGRSGNGRSRDRNDRRVDQSVSRQPQFKDEGSKQRFKKKVYQAAMEEFKSSSHDLFAHLAADDDSDSDEYEDAVDKMDGDGGADESTEYLNAAISLDMLLN
jgi:hypothetical protein